MMNDPHARTQPIVFNDVEQISVRKQSSVISQQHDHDQVKSLLEDSDGGADPKPKEVVIEKPEEKKEEDL